MRSETITSTDGTELVLWERPCEGASEAVLFVHGATYGARATFGVTPPCRGEPSWFDETAERGRAAVGIDIRGYGGSGPPAAGGTGAATKPVRAATAAEDVRSAYRHLDGRFDAIHLVAFSWGTVVTGRLVTEYDVDPASIAMVAPVYKPPYGFADAPGGGSDPPGGTRTVTRADARRRWDGQIESDPPAERRFGTGDEDPVFDAFWAAVHDSEQRVDDADEPTIVAPAGFLHDVRAACEGEPVYDAGEITAPTVIARGRLDTTATRADALTLFDELGCNDASSYAEFAGGTHMLLYERPRRRVFDAVESIRTHPA